MGEEGNDGSKIKLCSPKYARSGFLRFFNLYEKKIGQLW